MSRYSGRRDDGRPDTSRTVTRLDVIHKLAPGLYAATQWSPGPVA